MFIHMTSNGSYGSNSCRSGVTDFFALLMSLDCAHSFTHIHTLRAIPGHHKCSSTLQNVFSTPILPTMVEGWN